MFLRCNLPHNLSLRPAQGLLLRPEAIDMTEISVVIFDVDGVLIDSLDAHLQVCRDEARQFGLDVEVPSAREFRKLVANGAVISPMVEFFRTVGFPPGLAERANEDYQREFARKYPLRPFAGVPEMLAQVAAAGVRLGIVTSNTRAIISSALAGAMSFFDARSIYAEDNAQRVSKAEALVECARNGGVMPDAVLYVGDQPRDFAAAQTAHTQFLGVTYGWGITPDDVRFELADSPGEIASFVRARTGAT